MQEFWFYVQLGLDHVLDINAYDHILFLSALAIPFTFRHWKQVLWLATIFTITHCFSLALSAFGLVNINVSVIEFLIPVTIVLTALYNLLGAAKAKHANYMIWHMVATAFFGLVHGFGFSNYFNMLVSDMDAKTQPLIAFAVGIELSQLIIVLIVLLIAYVSQSLLRLKQAVFIRVCSLIIIAITLPLLYETLPW